MTISLERDSFDAFPELHSQLFRDMLRRGQGKWEREVSEGQGPEEPWRGVTAAAIPRGLGQGKEGGPLLSSSFPTRLPSLTGSPA